MYLIYDNLNISVDIKKKQQQMKYFPLTHSLPFTCTIQ